MNAGGKRYIAHGSRSDEFTLYCLTDLHIGNAACDVTHLEADIERIRTDPYALWVGGGDNAEFISSRDKRFDPAGFDPDMTISDLGRLGTVLIERVAKLFNPIRDKCLGLAFGNHESKYMRAADQQHLHSWLCVHLGVENLDYTALFDLVFNNVSGVRKPRIEQVARKAENRQRQSNSFRVFVTHGAGAAQTSGGKINRLVRYMEYFDADIYFVGHVHDKVGKRLVTLGADRDCKKLVQRERLGIISGTYLQTYKQGHTPYGEEKGYRPTPLGASWVRIKPDTRQMEGSI